MADLATDAEVEAHLRRRDLDRWLSARLIADPAARRDVLALYAFEDAIRGVAGAVSNPMLGEIRFAWWSEAVEEVAAGRPARSHPVLAAVAPLIVAGRLQAEPLQALIAARHADLEPAPFLDAAALDGFLTGAYTAPMQAAARLLSPAFDASLSAVGRAWGLANLIRATPRWLANGRRWAPPEWGDDPADILRRARLEFDSALRDAAPQVAALPVKAFPAVAHAGLAKPYVRGREPSDLEKQTRLLWASLQGKL